MADKDAEFSIKLLVEVAGKIVLRFIDRNTQLEELKLKLVPTSEDIASFTYEYSDTRVSLENEDDMKAFLDLAFIENITTFRMQAIQKESYSEEPKRKKAKKERNAETVEASRVLEKEKRRAAFALLSQQREALGVVVKRGRPPGSKNKPKVALEPQSESDGEESMSVQSK